MANQTKPATTSHSEKSAGGSQRITAALHIFTHLLMKHGSTRTYEHLAEEACQAADAFLAVVSKS